MKKFFTLFAAALVVLSASAITPVKKAAKAEQNAPKMAINVIERNAPKMILRSMDQKAVIKHAPAVVADNAFAFDVTNITATSATVAVTPANLTATYYWTVTTQEMIDAIEAGNYASYNVTNVCEYMQYMVNYYLDKYSAYGYSFADFLSTGADSYSFTGMNPESEYVVVAIHLDENGCTGEYESYAFETEAVAESENVLTLTFDETAGTVAISTTNNDPYFFYLETTDSYLQYQTGYSEAEVSAELGDWIDYMDNYGAYYDVSVEDFIFSGDHTFTLSDLGIEDDGEYIAMAVPYEGAINGTAAWVVFNYVAPEVVATDTVTVQLHADLDNEDYPGWTDAVASQGWWQVMAYDDLTNPSIYATFSPSETSQVAGTYDIADMDGDYTGVTDAAYSTSTLYKFQTLTINVVAGTECPSQFTAEGLAKNGVYYIMSVDFVHTAQAVENVEATVKAVKAVKNGQLVIIKNGVEYNAQGARL